MFWHVLLANCDAQADLFHVSKHTSSNIGTSWVVTEILRDLFFAAVRSREARLNRYVRHGDLQSTDAYIMLWTGGSCASYFWGVPGGNRHQKRSGVYRVPHSAAIAKPRLSFLTVVCSMVFSVA